MGEMLMKIENTVKIMKEIFCKTKEMAERKIQKKNKNKEEIK